MALRTTIGERRWPVHIDARTADAVDASGAPIEGWAPLTDPAVPQMMAKIPLGGSERFAGEQVTAPYDTRWRFGYRPDMDPDLVNVAADRRLIYLNRTHDIITGQVIGYRAEIELLTQARQG